MSVQTVGHKFVELCRQGKNFDVMQTMYAPNIVSVEGDGKETTGQEPVIKKSFRTGLRIKRSMGRRWRARFSMAPIPISLWSTSHWM